MLEWGVQRTVTALTLGYQSTGVFKAGKFEKEILSQFPPNEFYLYDINIKLSGIV